MELKGGGQCYINLKSASKLLHGAIYVLQALAGICLPVPQTATIH